MTRLYLVRHGRAEAGWGSHVDPGLDDVGREQAEAAVRELDDVGPLPVVTSPLRRTRATAAAFERAWAVAAAVDPAVGEIRAPTDDLVDRVSWLTDAMAGRWSDLDPSYGAWRDDVVGALVRLQEDTVVVTHYVAINAAVGVATGDDRLVCFSPDNCSVTTLESDGTSLRVVTLGRVATTEVR